MVSLSHLLSKVWKFVWELQQRQLIKILKNPMFIPSSTYQSQFKSSQNLVRVTVVKGDPCKIYFKVPPTWGCVFWDVERVHRPGELGGVVIHITDSNIYSHIRGLKAIIRTNKQGIFGTTFSVQSLGSYQIFRFRVNSEAVIGSTDDRICDKSICTLGKREQNRNCQKQNS